jgi:hypothetical protein
MEDVETAAKLNGILCTSTTSASQLNRKEFTKDDIVQLLEETNAKLPLNPNESGYRPIQKRN